MTGEPRAPLERLLRPVLPEERTAAVVGDGANGRTWLHADGWRVFAAAGSQEDGQPIARFELDGGATLEATLDARTGSVRVPFDLADAYRAYVEEEWVPVTGDRRRLSSQQLDVFYRLKHLIPRAVQLEARRLLIRWQGVPDFPAWPLDTSVSHLLRFYAFCLLRAYDVEELEFAWFWPDGYEAALILTHDVESDEGLRLALELADLEQELGFRSSFNLGAWYEVDPGLVRELAGRGFEVGVHGLAHDRSLFASRASFERQLPALRQLAERIGAVGFRSPATHRVHPWIGELPFAYDASVPNSDPFEPQPGGCCSVWPFFVGQVVELPYTLPQDHTLFTLLGHESPALWIEQSLRIESEFGLIQCVTHPDPGYLGDRRKRARYAEFLRALAERPALWRALPRDVAAWWRERDAGAAELSYGVVRDGGAPTEVVVVPPGRRDKKPTRDEEDARSS